MIDEVTSWDPRNCKWFFLQVTELSEEEKARVMKMQKTDMSIEDRRMWFNDMARKFANKMYVATLPPGALEKYQAASNGSKEKFDMLKQFICDESLQLVGTNWAIPSFPFWKWLYTDNKCMKYSKPHRGKTWKSKRAS
jgi:hypothetical protein